VTSAHDTSRVEESATIGGLPVRTHDHVCVLYRGEDQRDELMAKFLAGGVRAGHRCYCLITPDHNQRIAAAVSRRNARAAAGAASEDPARLDFVGPGECYLRGGEFLSDRMLRFWDDWGTATFERDGVAYARVGADMSWAKPLIDARGFVMDLARYETRFTIWARRYPQVTACLYDLDRFDGDVIVPLVRAHPKVWMNGVVLTNPYYLQSEHFSAAEADELNGHVAAPG
jgi:MEDS: MEthanogen/methylotroph, DcmR Sensory domain